jgi:hypothetical protein
MQLLYNSDHFTVVQIDVASPSDAQAPARSGYEIVDKLARMEVFLQGAVADTFQRGVHALAADSPDVEVMDDFIAGYTHLAAQPLAMH